jgi:hypothetical protein
MRKDNEHRRASPPAGGNGWYSIDPGRHAPDSDVQIIDAVRESLETDGTVVRDSIRVSCSHGIVRLQGAIEDYWLRRRINDRCGSVRGVRQVINELHSVPVLLPRHRS